MTRAEHPSFAIPVPAKSDEQDFYDHLADICAKFPNMAITYWAREEVDERGFYNAKDALTDDEWRRVRGNLIFSVYELVVDSHLLTDVTA